MWLIAIEDVNGPTALVERLFFFSVFRRGGPISHNNIHCCPFEAWRPTGWRFWKKNGTNWRRGGNGMERFRHHFHPFLVLIYVAEKKKIPCECNTSQMHIDFHEVILSKADGRRVSAAIWNWSGGSYNGICFRRDFPGHVVGQPALLLRRLTIDTVGFPRGGGQLQTHKQLCRGVPSCIRSCRGLSGLFALDPCSAFQQQVLITTGLSFFSLPYPGASPTHQSWCVLTGWLFNNRLTEAGYSCGYFSSFSCLAPLGGNSRQSPDYFLFFSLLLPFITSVSALSWMGVPTTPSGCRSVRQEYRRVFLGPMQKDATGIWRKHSFFFGYHFFGECCFSQVVNLSYFWFFIIWVLPDDKQVHRFIAAADCNNNDDSLKYKQTLRSSFCSQKLLWFPLGFTRLIIAGAACCVQRLRL